MRSFTVARLSVTALVAAACTAQPAERVTKEEAPIVGTEAHVDDTHAAVVVVTGERGSLCSGTLIGRSADGDRLHVLTAAHCCQRSGPPRTIRVGADASEPARTFPVEHCRKCEHLVSWTGDAEAVGANARANSKDNPDATSNVLYRPGRKPARDDAPHP